MAYAFDAASNRPEFADSMTRAQSPRCEVGLRAQETLRAECQRSECIAGAAHMYGDAMTDRVDDIVEVREVGVRAIHADDMGASVDERVQERRRDPVPR